MKDIFYDKTEEVIDLLWNLTEKFYDQPLNKDQNNDLLEEIYKDKNDNPKKFASQMINPNASLMTDKSNKPLFNSAIEKVRDDKFRDDKREPYNREYRDNRDQFPYNKRGGDYRRYEDNYRGRGGREDRRELDRPRRNDREENVKTMKIGDKHVVIRKRSNVKSRSRSRSNEKKERERSRENDSLPQDKREERENDYERDPEYDRDYHHQRGGYQQRGGYPTRGGYPMRGGYYQPMRGGRYPRYPQQQGFMPMGMGMPMGMPMGMNMGMGMPMIR